RPDRIAAADRGCPSSPPTRPHCRRDASASQDPSCAEVIVRSFPMPGKWCRPRQRRPKTPALRSDGGCSHRPRLPAPRLEVLEDRLLLSAAAPVAAFDPGSGLLSLLGPAVVRSAGDFIQVQSGGATASSDPRSSSFNPALAGATRTSLTAVRDAGPLTVQDLSV